MPFYAGQKLKASNLGQLSTIATYSQSAQQTITTATDTPITFDTATQTSDYVTRAVNGVGHSFTINVTGLYMVAMTWRWALAFGSSTGEKSCHIKNQLGIWFHSASVQGNAATSPINQQIAFPVYLTAGDSLVPEAYQNSGGNQLSEANSLLGWPRIDIAFILGG